MFRWVMGLLLLGSVLGITSAAEAATIATGPIGTPNGNGTASCRAANISSKPREVTIEVYNQNGTLVSANTTTLQPDDTVLRSAVLTAGQSAYCVFRVKGGKNTIRGELCMNQLTLNRHYCVSAR